MELGYNLTLKQAQKLIMTPELRQAIELLQFTSLELDEYLENQIEINPLLEMEETKDEHENMEEDSKEDEEIDWKEVIESYDDISYKPQNEKDQKEYTYENFVSYSPSLKEHLLLQIKLSLINKKDIEVGEILIDYIDEDGYFRGELEQIGEELNRERKSVESVLKKIQTFDPIGVGARDLKECLAIQLRSKNIKEPNVYEIVENHLEDIAKNRLQKISKELDIELKEVQKNCDLIRTLEPKPGRGYSGNEREVKYITPDVILRKIDGEYFILLNDITAPRLNINRYYKELITKSNDTNISDYLTKKLNSAMWIIKSIEQRRMTIYNVVKSILKHQEDFLKKGEKALKPLTLKEVADDINVHESTVSRAVNGKYMQAPNGLFELKYFFSSGVSSNKGDVSAISIKAIIKDLIEKEDVKKPLSDQKITDILKGKGISISRRTVAKYRDELNIPSSTLRKRY